MQRTNSEIRHAGLVHSGNQSRRPFDHLPGHAGIYFQALGKDMSYSRGDRLFSEGEKPQCIFVVQTARIKLSVTSHEGRTMILRIAAAGQVLGLGAALSVSQHEVSAEALEFCRVKAICARDFFNFLEKYPEAAMDATHCLLEQYCIVFADVRRLALPGTVAGRLATLLLDWGKGGRQRQDTNLRFTLALTHDEIAAMTGTSREMVSRTLHRFQREKIISIKGTSVALLRPQALQRLAA